MPFVKDYARYKDLKRAKSSYEHFNIDESNLQNYAWLSYFFDQGE